MAKLIYIREIDSNTFLHLSIAGETVKLRDFSLSATKAPTPFCPPGMTPQKIAELASQPPNRLRDREPEGKKDPGINDIAFWNSYILDLNRKLIPVADEARRRELEIKKLEHEANILWWKKAKWIIAAVTAFIGLIGLIAGYWKQIAAAIF